MNHKSYIESSIQQKFLIPATKSAGLRLLFFLLCSLLMASCQKEEDSIPAEEPQLKDKNTLVLVKWADMSLYTLRHSLQNTPTYASRSLGYLGLCMYESVVHSDPSYRSMSGQLNGLTLPTPDPEKEHHWLIALNTAQGSLLKLLYPVPSNAFTNTHRKIDSLSNALYHEISKDVPADISERSVAWGNDLAQAIWEWSRNDGGHEGYTRNFDPEFVFPSGPSYWSPALRGQMPSPFPLHPYWGSNRTFAPANAHLPIPAILPYSSNPSSEYYKQYKAVYSKSKMLRHSEKEIAAWWGDDPTETASPPGHSYQIATIAIKTSNAGPMKAAEAYAKTGMAVADAFIDCWKVKYTYFNERPSSFIRSNIQNDWEEFWPQPPFPAFPSGHSLQGAAAATVLTNVFGDHFPFVDNTHKGHRRYDDARYSRLRYPARSFRSFWQAAEECAYSRFLGGIHTQQDNDVGMEEGRKVGNNILALQWKN